MQKINVYVWENFCFTCSRRSCLTASSLPRLAVSTWASASCSSASSCFLDDTAWDRWLLSSSSWISNSLNWHGKENMRKFWVTGRNEQHRRLLWFPLSFLFLPVCWVPSSSPLPSPHYCWSPSQTEPWAPVGWPPASALSSPPLTVPPPVPASEPAGSALLFLRSFEFAPAHEP